MPAARHRSRSPCHGMRRHRDDPHVAAASRRSRSRMAAVASKPPISGICTSIRTSVEGCALDRARSASRPFARDHRRDVPRVG